MTVEELFNLYKQGYNADKQLILSDYRNRDGFRVENEEDFDIVIKYLDGEQAYIIDRNETKDNVIFDYFTIKRASPTIVVVRHPTLRNAYWKERPDKMLDSFATPHGGVYRYLFIDYGNLVKDYVIELPSTVDDVAWKLLQKRMPEAFRTKVSNDQSTLSIVFTNSDRFKELDAMTFRMLDLDELYPALKKPDIKAFSNKLWKELKKTHE